MKFIEAVWLRVRSSDGDHNVMCALAPDILSKLWDRNPDLYPAAILEAALTKLALEVAPK